MNMDLFIKKLGERLNLPLPGKRVQHEMSPLRRISRLAGFFNNKHPKKSSVLILLYPRENSLFFVITQRPIYNGMHSGQICLPGGKYEKNDIDLYDTALREAQEEVNADASRIKKIGALSALYVPPSNFSIQPYVGFVESEPDFKKQAEEVEEIILVDLFKFMKNPVLGKKQIPTNRRISINAPFYDIEGYIVWGATAMILSEFFYIVNEVLLQDKKH